MDNDRHYYVIEGKSGPGKDGKWFRWWIPFKKSQWDTYTEAVDALEAIENQDNRSNYGFRIVKVTMAVINTEKAAL